MEGIDDKGDALNAGGIGLDSQFGGHSNSGIAVIMAGIHLDFEMGETMNLDQRVSVLSDSGF